MTNNNRLFSFQLCLTLTPHVISILCLNSFREAMVFSSFFQQYPIISIFNFFFYKKFKKKTIFCYPGYFVFYYIEYDKKSYNHTTFLLYKKSNARPFRINPLPTLAPITLSPVSKNTPSTQITC